MLKPSIILIAVAASVVACGPQAEDPELATPIYEPGWRYTYGEDKLRNVSSVEALLGSNEVWGTKDEPVMALAVRSGTPDEDGVDFVTGELQSCTGEFLIRVDSHPIESFPCSYLDILHPPLSLSSDLAQRIMVSREVVLEIPLVSGRQQLTFKTEGLQLDAGS